MSDPPSACCAHCELPVPVARRGGSGARYCCFGCHLAADLARPAGESAGTLPLRLGLGVFLTMNIMVFSGLGYAYELYGGRIGDDPQQRALATLFAYLLMALATLVVATLGGPLALDRLGTRGGRRGRIDADTLIAIGVGAAFLLSVVNTVRGRGGLYFDTVAVLLVLVTLGRYLDSTARRRAMDAASSLLASIPRCAWVRRGDAVIEAPVDQVEPGTLVRVRAGEAIPVDGVVQDGAAHVDESVLTGEAMPRSVGPGDSVLAAATAIDGQLWIAVRQAGADRVVARTQALLAAARLRQPRIQRQADRVAGVFVPLVVLLAGIVFTTRAVAGEPIVGLLDGLAVLLISCPCALGLAVPLAMHFALARLAGRGVLVDGADTVERAARIGTVVFDKTGTLTELRPRLDQIHVFGANDGAIDASEALSLAAAIESASLHPIAIALTAAMPARATTSLEVEAVTTLPGRGLEATVAGRRLWLGSARLAGERSGAAMDVPGIGAAPGATAVFLGCGATLWARFDLTERPRDDAQAAITELRQMGIAVRILSGDRPDQVARIAAALGLDPADAAGGCLPADKLQRLAALQQAGAGVAMVGDGINDAPVLAVADVGFSVSGGTDLAQQAGHVRLLADRLDRVPLTLAVARSTMRTVRLNLLWAFAYNLIGLSLAASGMLSPVFAAAAMVGSSVLVIHTSRRAGAIAEVSVSSTVAAPAIELRRATP